MDLSRLESEFASFLLRRSTVFAVELALVVALAYVAASFIWAFNSVPFGRDASATMGALGGGAERANVPLGILTRFDPFHREPVDGFSQGAIAMAPPETKLDVKLFGIRLPSDGGEGTAIIRLQNYRHAVLAPGEKISAGVTLSEIHNGYVVISQNGRYEALYLDAERNEGGEGEIPLGASDSEAATIVTRAAFTPEELLQAASFNTYRDERGNISGFALRFSEDVDLPLPPEIRSGDVVVEINGTSVADLGQLADLQQSLQGADRVVLVVEREGERTTIELGNP